MNSIKDFIMRFKKKNEEPQEAEQPVIITVPKGTMKVVEETAPAADNADEVTPETGN